jgi:hypothetical protein
MNRIACCFTGALVAVRFRRDRATEAIMAAKEIIVKKYVLANFPPLARAALSIKISLQLVTDDLRSYGAAVGAESGRKASLPALR